MQSTFSTDMRDKIIAFLFGDLFVTVQLFISGIIYDFGHFALKVLGTLIIGAAGGIAGMAAKDLYAMAKRHFKKRVKL